jgi:hypothetical protein
LNSFTYIDTANYDGWYTLRLRNASAAQPGQKCWVKATYKAPEVVNTTVVKNKCACVSSSTSNTIDLEKDFAIFPNPATNALTVSLDGPNYQWEITDLNGRVVKTGVNNTSDFEVNVADLQEGLYYFNTIYSGAIVHKKFLKLDL